jgi:hypothetical protein
VRLVFFRALACGDGPDDTPWRKLHKHAVSLKSRWSPVPFLSFFLTAAFVVSPVYTLSAQSDEDELFFAVGSIASSEEAGDAAEEQLLDEAEMTLFDIYLADVLQGLALVSYTDEVQQIDSPADVLEQLRDIDSSEILPLFEGPIYGSRVIEGVGSVVLDPFTFRIVVELDRRYLPASSLDLSGRLPDPDGGVSLQQAISTAISGDFDSEAYQASLTHRSTLGMGRFFAKLDGTAVKDSDYLITRGSVSGIVGENEIGAGLLQTEGQSFAASTDILGLQFGTSEDLLLDRETLRGSRLQIFVPSRARVEFYRDARLLSVQTLDFGLQEVDTQVFPTGSYNVDVIIREDSGRVSQESVFFVKTGFLSVRDTPIFSLQAGVLRDRLDVFEVPSYQAGIRWRAFDAAEVRASLAGTDDLSIGELELRGVIGEYFASAGISASTEANVGLGGTLSGYLFDMPFFVSHLQTVKYDSESGADLTQVQGRARRLAQIEERLNSISRRRSSTSLSVSRQMGAVNLRFVASRNERSRREPPPIVLDTEELAEIITRESRYTYGPRVEWLLFRNRPDALRLDSSYLRTERGYSFVANLSYRFRPRSGVVVDSRLRGSAQESGADELALRNTVSYDSIERSGLGIRARLSNEVVGRNDDESDVRMVTQLDLDRRGRFLRGAGFLRDSRFGVRDVTSAGLVAETSFLVTDEGSVAVSSPPQTEAIFIADLRGSSVKTPEILTAECGGSICSFFYCATRRVR